MRFRTYMVLVYLWYFGSYVLLTVVFGWPSWLVVLLLLLLVIPVGLGFIKLGKPK